MPYPQPNEDHDKYISRCMGDSEMNSKHPDQKQRYAICESFWNQKTKGEEDAKLIVDEITKLNNQKREKKEK